MKKTYFFGWTNFKWLVREVNNIYSESNQSFYSKKRIESGVAFLIAQWGLIHWLILNVGKISVSEITLWAAVDLAISGYIVNKIEKGKMDTTSSTTVVSTETSETK